MERFEHYYVYTDVCVCVHVYLGKLAQSHNRPLVWHLTLKALTTLLDSLCKFHFQAFISFTVFTYCPFHFLP